MIVMNVEEGNLPDAINIIVTKHGANQLCVCWNEEEQCWQISFPQASDTHEQDERD